MANVYLEEFCRADRNLGSNYGKPHVWVDGKYNGEVRQSCLFCGRWKDANSRTGFQERVQGQTSPPDGGSRVHGTLYVEEKEELPEEG